MGAVTVGRTSNVYGCRSSLFDPSSGASVHRMAERERLGRQGPCCPRPPHVRASACGERMPAAGQVPRSRCVIRWRETVSTG